MLVEEVSSPWLLLHRLILQVLNCCLGIVSFQKVALVAISNIVMEWVLKGEGVEVVINLEDNSTLDGVVFGPGHGDDSSCVEESWSDHLLGEVLFKTALGDMPADNLHISALHAVSDLNNMESIVVEVVALESVPLIVVEVNVVVVAELIGWVEPGGGGNPGHHDA